MVALAAALQGPFSPWVLTQRNRWQAVLPVAAEVCPAKCSVLSCASIWHRPEVLAEAATDVVEKLNVELAVKNALFPEVQVPPVVPSVRPYSSAARA